MSYFLKPAACRGLLLTVILWAATTAHGQIIITNFPGLTLNNVTALGTGGTPPDTMGAAGTNQFVEFINGGFAVYNKSGVQQSLVSDIAFWENAGISSNTIAAGLTDTRVIYDAGSGRWIATELTTEAITNTILLARSDTSDPGGTWKAVSLKASTTDFGDFDTLDVDSQGIYIAVNDFNSAGGFDAVSLFSIPKADILAATPSLSNLTRFDNLNADTYGFSPQGVCNPDAGPGHGVICAIDNVNLKVIDRTTINGANASGATLSTPVLINCTFDAVPNAAHQPSGKTIDAGDDRFSAAIRQIGNYIFMANCVLQGTKDAVHWLVLNETNNTVVGEGIISDATYDYYYPSIAANHKGNILLAFNRSGTVSPAGDISIYAAVGAITGNIVTMGSPFLLNAGTIRNYALSFDKTPYRWGDYSATMLDPTDDNLLWTIQEIPAAANNWGTQITLISMATNRPTLGITRSGSAINLAWPLSTDPAYVLQSNTNLLLNTWTTLTNRPVFSINQNIVTLTVTNRPLFFRLKK